MQENLLARYAVLHELGRGPTGAVYAARDRTTGAVVALKRFNPGFSGKPARLPGHRNIVEIYDAGEVAGTFYVAMEMLEGRNLRALLDEAPLGIARAIRITHDIASGLAHAHLQGIVHGGLTASNVILLRSGAAKITDFRGDPVDHRDDIFALGALFYEMLTHRPPGEKPAPPSEVNPHLPRALDAIVMSMLAKDPADRMAGVPILLNELQRFEEASAPPERPEPALRPIDPEAFARHREMMERQSRPRSSASRSVIFSILGLLAAVGIGFGSYMYYSSNPRESRATAPPPVAEGPKEPVAAFSPWKEAPPRVADNPQPEQAPAKARAAVRPIAPPPVAKAITEPATAPGTMFGLKPPAADPAPLAKTEEPVEPEPEQPAAAPARQQPVRPAQLVLAVSPGGELYIDGVPHGATPPNTTFDLAPGMHRIEVRSGSRKPFLTYMTVQAGDVRRIRHDFNAMPSRPPT
jgi:serine/threonine-protein kinase